MIRIIKLGNLIYENIEAKYIDENGNEIWNIPNTLSELQQAIQDTIVWLAKQRLQKTVERYSYNGLEDVLFYAQNNDDEAKAILNWYSNNNGNGYDDLIWDWIDNTLPTYTTIDELLDLDLNQIEIDIFNQSIQNNPLP